MADDIRLTPWLIRKSEGVVAARYPVGGEVIRIGRSRENDFTIADEPHVSAHHIEIRRVGGEYWVYDLDSTNGTYLNGEPVKAAMLQAPASIRLGKAGPEFEFVMDDTPRDANETLVYSGPFHITLDTADPAQPISGDHEKLLTRAVQRARRARSSGAFDQTAMIMRSMLGEVLKQSTRKFKVAIVSLAIALAGVSAYGVWQIGHLKQQKRRLDGQMVQIETQLEKSNQDPAETEQLLDRLDQYEGQEKALENTVLYRIGAREREDPVTRGIRSLMFEFGAETYSIPPEFLDAVNNFIVRYQGPDRGTTERALGDARSYVESMREIFKQNNLPPDLAYVALAESGMHADPDSPAGAVGWWQFTPATAKHFGLKIDGETDERKDARKSTEAAAKYIRDLILDFGAGSSVMLALAAYDLGPAKVKQAIRRVSDPIRQRNFWYLYRIHALPVETREYVPKVIAAMIIARNPQQFGF